MQYINKNYTYCSSMNYLQPFLIKTDKLKWFAHCEYKKKTQNPLSSSIFQEAQQRKTFQESCMGGRVGFPWERHSGSSGKEPHLRMSDSTLLRRAGAKASVGEWAALYWDD